MSSSGLIRAMVVDDHPIVRNGLREALEGSGRFDVVGLAGDGEEAVRNARELAPEVIVMDVIMPNKDGIDACREIMELLPDTRVMMLTASTEEDAVIEAMAAGATGYLQKYSPPEELVEAVLDVARGSAANTRQVSEGGLHYAPKPTEDRYPSAPGQTDGCGAGDPKAICLRQDVCRDRRGERQQHCDRSQHPLPHTGQAEHRDEAGTRDLGCAERPG